MKNRDDVSMTLPCAAPLLSTLSHPTAFFSYWEFRGCGGITVCGLWFAGSLFSGIDCSAGGGGGGDLGGPSVYQ